MSPRAEAEQHLRVIRTLMERATIYRAISAPTALIGGILALVAAGGSLLWLQAGGNAALPTSHFVWLWLCVLAVTLIANTAFVWQEAHARGASMISPSMRLALWSVLPVLLAAGAFTTLEVSPLVMSVWWALFYGLALLATAHFSPRSLRILGWAFLATGLLGVLFLRFASADDVPAAAGDMGSMIMGGTFGLYHIIYALCAWPRRSDTTES